LVGSFSDIVYFLTVHWKTLIL